MHIDTFRLFLIDLGYIFHTIPPKSSVKLQERLDLQPGLFLKLDRFHLQLLPYIEGGGQRKRVTI